MGLKVIELDYKITLRIVSLCINNLRSARNAFSVGERHNSVLLSKFGAESDSYPLVASWI